MSDNNYAVKVDKDLAELIPGYLANRRADIEQIRLALSHRDFETIRIAGHTMKGIGSSYGFELITALGINIENAAKVQDAAAIERYAGQLANYIQHVRIDYI